MKLLFITIFSFCLFSNAFSQEVVPQVKAKTLNTKKDKTQKVYIAQASCGQCKFGMQGNGCSLAVKIKGKSYFVDGTGIDDHGDSHGADGFCEVIKTAEVQGKIVNGRFLASYFKIVEKSKAKK